ncbi:MAG: hypothetical protein KIS66_05280 [Fimbriimonadaceae bacterium]|nr:hypothetical protein [Fimbriimonadaceae bacterium]
MDSGSRVPLYYTFGNHQHWVDLQWLWGYHVMPGSVDDMVFMIEETGTKGCVNFDGIGYEKLAAESPETIAQLRKGVREGTIEVVGGSYGQPYGLFHPGESNVRQRIYGARAVRRVLGAWPTTFWEEEFDFFPQLPQMLARTGYRNASLFFQWTWHTPEVPRETSAAVWWEGPDGSRLLTATRNALNLHQWPEDMQILFDQLAAGQQPVAGVGNVPPLILQWVELMRTPDWMCRTEVLLPKLKALLQDPRFEIRATTLGAYLDLVRADGGEVPVRRYSLDDVWHGMSNGKNDDRMRQASRETEENLLAAESLAAMLGLFGRPYPRWDVYPTYELEEAWRHLLATQHHDNDECEVLCGHVAKAQHAYAQELAPTQYSLEFLAERVGLSEGQRLVYNPLPWEVTDAESGTVLPPIGYAVVERDDTEESADDDDPPDSFWATDHGYEGVHDDLRVVLDTCAQTVRLLAPGFPEGLFGDALVVTKRKDGKEVRFKGVHDVIGESDGVFFTLRAEGTDETIGVEIKFDAALDGFAIWTSVEMYQGPEETVVPEWVCDPGLNGAYRLHLEPSLPDWTIRTDAPYSVQTVRPNGEWPKKYPEGDWMTSAQWFEKVRDPFHSSTFVDVADAAGKGVQIVHESSQQWFLADGAIQNVLTMRDPWDNGLFLGESKKQFVVVPHEKESAREMWQRAQTCFRKPIELRHRRYHRAAVAPEVDLPAQFGALKFDARHSLVTAFYREIEEYAGKYLDDYAGRGMGYPYVVRLVEFDGVGEEATLHLPGAVAAAFRTNLLGSIEGRLDPEPSGRPDFAHGLPDLSWSALRVGLKPYEIVTLYLDLEMGRKETRDLDAKRHVWATVHRV